MTSDLCWTFFSNGSLFRECPARSFPMHCNGDQDFFCPALAIFDLLPSWGGLQNTFYHLNKRICDLDKYILQFGQLHFPMVIRFSFELLSYLIWSHHGEDCRHQLSPNLTGNIFPPISLQLTTYFSGTEGSFVLHLPIFYLLGFCWDDLKWDRSQQLPSQTPTIHPSQFF